MAALDQVIAQIRFQLEQLSAKNAHHEFEHLCRYLARARICSNILPATGPVSKGGDQGRDFETFKSYLEHNLPYGSGFIGLISGGPVAFACTLTRAERIRTKIRADVEAIVTSGNPVVGIHIFCAVDVQVSERHALQNWARDEYNVHLEVYDGQALAELLAEPDLFWIAERYLHVPFEIYPFPSTTWSGTTPRTALSVDTAPHQLASPPSDFVGRTAKIEEVADVLDRHAASIIGIWGMGGVGKTTFALKLAEMFEEQFNDAQIFVDLKGMSTSPLAPTDVMSYVVRAYSPIARVEENEAELRGQYYSVLHRQRALLVFDNAVDESQIAPLIPPRTCLLLITSRQHFTLPGLHSVHLDLFSSEESRQLLLSIAPRIEDNVDQISRLSGYLPLALRLIGSILKTHEDLPPARYIKQLEDDQKRLSDSGVTASLSSSLALLTEDTKQRFCELAVFSETFDLTGASNIWDLELSETQLTLSELAGASMITWNQTTSRYHLHDLVRLFAEQQLDKGIYGAPARVRWRHAEYYAEVLRAAESLYEQGGDATKKGAVVFEVESSNIQAGQQWAALHKDVERGANLSLAFALMGKNFLELRQHPNDGVRWLQVGLVIAERTGNSAAALILYGRLGNAQYVLGELEEALACYKHRLLIARQLNEWLEESCALGDIARIHYALGDIRLAIDVSKQRLRKAQERKDLQQECVALGNLGGICIDLGELRDALQYEERRLSIAREVGDWREEAYALSELGAIYYSSGPIARAVDYYSEQLRLARENRDWLLESLALGNMGTTLIKLGEPRKALEYYEQRLETAREVGKVREEGLALGDLGGVYQILGRADLAHECYEQRLRRARESGDLLEEGYALGNLGAIYEDSGRVQYAVGYYKQRLTNARKSGMRSELHYALGNLGTAFFFMREFDKASTYFEQQLGLAQANADIWQQAHAHIALGWTFVGLHDKVKAAEHFESARKKFTTLDLPLPIHLKVSPILLLIPNFFVPFAVRLNSILRPLLLRRGLRHQMDHFRSYHHT